MNRALSEAQGEVIVFLQDHIEIEPDALERIWTKYQEYPETCFTMPVGKRHGNKIDWDWRYYWKHKEEITPDRWEIDFGFCPARAILLTKFNEKYDDGFGWENVDTGYIMGKEGWKFAVDIENKAIAFDHDASEEHPFKKKTNSNLWLKRKSLIDFIYEEQEVPTLRNEEM